MRLALLRAARRQFPSTSSLLHFLLLRGPGRLARAVRQARIRQNLWRMLAMNTRLVIAWRHGAAEPVQPKVGIVLVAQIAHVQECVGALGQGIVG